MRKSEVLWWEAVSILFLFWSLTFTFCFSHIFSNEYFHLLWQAKLQVGDVVKCCIKKITYFGIFVEVSEIFMSCTLVDILFGKFSLQLMSCVICRATTRDPTFEKTIFLIDFA